jgi:hypothetical protein
MTIISKIDDLLPDLFPRTKEANYHHTVLKQLHLPFNRGYEVSKGFVEGGEE